MITSEDYEYNNKVCCYVLPVSFVLREVDVGDRANPEIDYLEYSARL